MAISRQYENFNNVIVNLVYQPMFFSDSSRIYRTIKTFQLFNLASAGSGMIADFISR